MRRVLIDTDYLLDVEKGKARLPPAQIFLSILSLYEFIRGRKDYEKTKDMLEKSLIVVPITNEILIKAVEIYRDLKNKGENIDERDLLIGASAIALGISLKTRNKKHYEKLLDYGLKFDSD